MERGGKAPGDNQASDFNKVLFNLLLLITIADIYIPYGELQSMKAQPLYETGLLCLAPQHGPDG